MERLTRRDLLSFVQILDRVYAPDGLHGYALAAISAARTLVPAEFYNYAELDLRTFRVDGIMEPEYPETREAFQRHAQEDPVVAHYSRTGDGRALKISDFMSRAQFHRTGLYQEVYRPGGLEDRMTVQFRPKDSLAVAVSSARGRRTFAERDRLLMTLLRPHLVQAYRSVEAVGRLQRELALVGRGVEALSAGLVVLCDGHVRGMTPAARVWLETYFGRPTRAGQRLPEDLGRWVRQQVALQGRTDGVPPPREPFVVARDGKRLVVRLVGEGGQRLLLLQEERTAPDPVALERFGLTRRQAEVLAWVAQGKTNADIGVILGARPSTVAKHLEQIYQKLGVETRTAAAAMVLTSPPPP